MSEQVLLNGVTVGSLVVANHYGVNKYGKVIEIDNDATRSSYRGNVRIQYVASEEQDWYHEIDVSPLTVETCQRHRQELQEAIAKLDAAQAMITEQQNS